MSNQTELVVICGLKGSGKDTAALALIGNEGFTKVSFAQPLKDMLATLMRYQGATEEFISRSIEGDLKEISNPYFNGATTRRAMETLGTEWGRDLIHPDLWLDVAGRRAMNFESVVMTDLRFPNEHVWASENKAMIVRITNPNVVEDETHVSESYMKSFPVDITLENSGTIRAIQAKLLSAVMERRQRERVKGAE